MRVALCQMPVSSDPSVNLGRVQKALADAALAGAQLAVFPEGTQVRFGTDLRAAAEPTDGPFCQGLSEAAREHGVAVVAGVFEPGPGRARLQHRRRLRRARAAGRRVPEDPHVRRARPAGVR